MQALHSLDVFPRGSLGLIVRIVQLVANEEFGCRVGTTPPARLNLFDDFGVDLSIADGFHHRKVLEIVVCLEQGIASEEFDNNAPNAPYVTRKTPSQVQNDLRCSIMPR